MRKQQKGSARIVIEGVTPEADGGRFPIKRITGDKVAVEADIFADRHDNERIQEYNILSSIILIQA